jgi:predicted DNA-binding transcriptional regulator AlpA
MKTILPIGEILSRKQAAQYLGVCQNTLDRFDIPRLKTRRRVMYRKSVIDQWLDSHTETKGAAV